MPLGTLGNGRANRCGTTTGESIGEYCCAIGQQGMRTIARMDMTLEILECTVELFGHSGWMWVDGKTKVAGRGGSGLHWVWGPGHSISLATPLPFLSRTNANDSIRAVRAILSADYGSYMYIIDGNIPNLSRGAFEKLWCIYNTHQTYKWAFEIRRKMWYLGVSQKIFFVKD